MELYVLHVLYDVVNRRVLTDLGEFLFWSYTSRMCFIHAYIFNLPPSEQRVYARVDSGC